MGIADKLKGKNPSVVGGWTYSWDKKSDDQIMYKIPKNIVWNDNIVVREDEFAVFMRDGKALSVFNKAGRYALTTQNIAMFGLADKIQELSGVKQLGEIYYIRRSEMRGKFGTKEPIAFRDTDFGIVRIRVFGQFAYRVMEPLLFLTQFIGTEGRTTSESIVDWMRDQIVMSLNDVMGELKRDKHMAVIDMPAYLEEMEQIILSRLLDDFVRYGVEMTKISGLNINLPDEIQKAIDERGRLQALGVNYMQYQAGQAMVKAAENPSGTGNLAGMGVGLGAGLGMGAGMAGAVQSGMQPQQPNPWDSQTPSTAAPPENRVKCPKCGHLNSPDQKFCSNCGARSSDDIACPKCAKDVKRADKFCPSCGERIAKKCPGCGKDVQAGSKFCAECGASIE